MKQIIFFILTVLILPTVSLAEDAAFGFAHRRSRTMTPADPLVLRYLIQLQDTSSPEKQILPSMECLEAQTFNNALVALAFMLEGQRERAERILDFYSNATDINNTNPTLQNFYYKGEPRGFFQFVAIRTHKSSDDANDTGDLHSGNCTIEAYNNPGHSDRWMGDMVWLSYAYEYYRIKYKSDKYAKVQKLMLDLIVSWYKDHPQGGGYIQHGWRKGDKQLHMPYGHHEGNIDCYALFKLYGKDDLAAKIKTWIDRELNNRNDLPLDLYTWRVMANAADPNILDYVEQDTRYRKTLTVNGQKAMGFFHGPVTDVQNIWLDGTGHIACAFVTCADKYHGYFYANQMDAFLIDRTIAGVKTRALPYTANCQGGYDWVNPKKGFISVCAWYILAKNAFNPMTLSRNLGVAM